MQKTIFLNGIYEDEVYIKQLDGFHYDKGDHLVCMLKKVIYELKQTYHQWYLKF